MIEAAVDRELQSSKPELGLVFVLLVGLSVAVTAFLPAAFFEFWRNLVLWVAGLIGGMLGQVVVSRADILTVNGFSMRVIEECTALNYVIILSTAILLYTRHTIGYRLAGVLITIPVIVLANAFRLIVTGISGTISQKLFDFVHEYLWVALFALLIFGLWKIWADRNLQFNRKVALRAAVIIGTCSAMYVLLIAIMPIYGPFLAYASSLGLKILLGDSKAAIFLINGGMQCNYGGASYPVPFDLEYFNVAVFAGLVLPLQRRGDWKTIATTLVCFFIALLLNALLIATMINLMIAHGQGSLASFLFIQKGLLLAVPFALWWIVASGERERIESTVGQSVD